MATADPLTRKCFDCGLVCREDKASAQQAKWFEAIRKGDDLKITDLPPYPFLCDECFGKTYAS